MKAHLLALALAASASMCLSGCAINTQTLTAATPFVAALAQAGCKGTLHLEGQATSAAAGVPSAHIENTFDGTCDPASVGKPAAPAAAPAAITPPV